MERFSRFLHAPKRDVVEWLQEQNLLANPLVCRQCDRNMELSLREGQHVDGFLWRCHGCRKKKSLRTNSFFAAFPKIPLSKLIMIIYFWGEDAILKKIARNLRISKESVGRVVKMLKQICAADLQRRPIIPFGGPAYIVKCDESKFNHKAKANRGRRARQDRWVFGVVSTESRPAKGYFQVVARRNRDTLLPIIDRCLLPGTEVHTDDWGAYVGLERHLANVARHRVVVHAHNFVDPVTGVHTQEIESAWNRLKTRVKSVMGIRSGDLQLFLDEAMWKDWRVPHNDNAIDSFLPVLAHYYPNVPV